MNHSLVQKDAQKVQASTADIAEAVRDSVRARVSSQTRAPLKQTESFKEMDIQAPRSHVGEIRQPEPTTRPRPDGPARRLGVWLVGNARRAASHAAARRVSSKQAPRGPAAQRFLHLGHGIFPRIVESAYPNTVQIAETPLLVLLQGLIDAGPAPDSSPLRDGDELLTFRDGNAAKQFTSFYMAYLRNDLFIYRGLNCSHFAYPAVLRGELRSEGDADRPSFTMGHTDTAKTRWLPGCFDRKLAEGVSFSGTDDLTLKLSETKDIPIAITVQIRAGVQSGLSVCWLNEGEQVVRGPLDNTQFSVCSLLWMKKDGPEFTDFPLELPELPPPRPYEPNEDALRKWSDRLDDWQNKIGFCCVRPSKSLGNLSLPPP